MKTVIIDAKSIVSNGIKSALSNELFYSELYITLINTTKSLYFLNHLID